MSNSPLQQAFYLIIDKDHFEERFKRPFHDNDKVYATDRHIMIFCDKENIDFEFENSYTVNASAIVPEPNTSEIIDLDQHDWKSLMTADEVEYIGKEVECGNCGATGQCDGVEFYKEKKYDYTYECPVCAGTGMEETPKEKLTGRKTFEFYDSIKFKNSYFNLRLFYKIKQVRDLLGGDIELVSYTTYDKAVLFKIGYCHIMIMPVMSIDNCVLKINQTPTQP